MGENTRGRAPPPRLIGFSVIVHSCDSVVVLGRVPQVALKASPKYIQRVKHVLIVQTSISCDIMAMLVYWLTVLGVVSATLPMTALGIDLSRLYGHLEGPRQKRSGKCRIQSLPRDIFRFSICISRCGTKSDPDGQGPTTPPPPLTSVCSARREGQGFILASFNIRWAVWNKFQTSDEWQGQLSIQFFWVSAKNVEHVFLFPFE